MLKNYFKIALRTLVKFKAYATINLLGLALGLASGILILIYVLDEISYDKFHAKADRIYRVGTDMIEIKSGNVNGSIEANGWPIGMLLEKNFPEVEKVVYLANASNLQINHGGKRFEERIFYAGKDFFNIFSFHLIKGDPSSALTKPNSIVLTKSMEKKYFGNEDALGKTMTFADTLVFEVTGVMKEVPQQSHMQFNMLLSFKTYELLNDGFSYDDGWGNLNVRNYVLLKPAVDRENFFKKTRNLYMDHVKEELQKWGMYMYVAYEPLTEIYLKTKRGNGMGQLGSIDRIYIVTGIAGFVILLACFNFINLATARSVYRAKEVGLRKVVGSTRQSLIHQFLSESLLLTLLSFVIALALIGLTLPLFNQLLGKTYSLISLTDPLVIVGIILLIGIVALLSGYYPAVVMSSLRPAEVLKGSMTTGSRGIQLRRVLVVIQFAISAALIICTMVVINQLEYMQNSDLGFSGRQVLVLDLDKVSDRGGQGSDDGVSAFKNELKELSTVESVTFTNAVPGRPGWVGQWAFPEDKPNDGSIGVEYMTVDEDYLKTLGLTLIAGRNFELDRLSEIADGLVVNETCVQKMGWGNPENALGKKIDSPSKHPAGTVIGVVKDYHEFGLQRHIYPMTMDYNPKRSRYFAIRFETKGTANLLTNIETLWKKHYNGYDFKYFFLDKNFAHQYQAEQRLSKMFQAFSVITIVIAIVGLIGLVSFMIVAKTKEIGVRKILGANVLSIAHLLSKEFLLLVLIANVIACPMAWYLTSQWLEKFAYRVTIGPMIFIATIITGLLITLVAVSFQTIKAALMNPVKSLRSE
ncbi:MAG: ABC transporter permease [Bacteroidetes bacterium]|nr:ABC transporter permease [Bacteroidota bacterium]MBI3481775.1 ABC transporter permease [Bacteroidota bacterium]